MSSGRDNILRAVREAVSAGRHGERPPHPERNGAGYQGAGGDEVERFSRELTSAGGVAHRATDTNRAADIVLSLVKSSGARRVLLGENNILPNLAEALTRAGLEIIRAEEADKAQYFAADVAVSGVDHLVAETGSLVMRTRRDQPRSLSLLAPVHVAVACREQIVEDLFDLFEENVTVRTGLPACVSIITGPSKTGDIELKLVTGVHGPGEVHVVLVG
jgi:L-lactate utilization protein LutC